MGERQRCLHTTVHQAAGVLMAGETFQRSTHPVSPSIALKGWLRGRAHQGNGELTSCCQVKSRRPYPFLSLLSYTEREHLQ